MQKRLPRILVILALIALVTVLLRFLGDPGDDPGPVGLAPPAESAAPAATGRAAAGPRKGAPPRRTLRLSEGVAERDAAQRAGAFAGRVVSARGGEPVAGAELGFAHAGVVATAVSGKDGAFRFAAGEPGAYALAFVNAKGFHPFAPDWGQSPITLVAREGEMLRDITITLVPEVTYQGLVRGPGGDPVRGAAVRIVGAAERAQGGAAAGRWTTNEEGVFSFAAPDDALIEASHPDFAPARARVDLGVQTSGRLVLRLGNKGAKAGGEATLAGKVVDERGEPVEGALVGGSFRAENPALPGSSLRGDAQATTDEHGEFTLEGLDEGRYDVIATDEGVATARAEAVPSGTRDLRLQLAAGGRIRGTVRARESGAPIAAFSIVVELHRGPLERETATSMTFFDARGEYEVGGLLPGTYSVYAAAHGFAPSGRSTVTMNSPPAEPVTADFDLGGGGRLTGTVVEEGSRKPIADAKVAVEGTIGVDATSMPLLAETATDAAGRFALEGIAEGVRSVSVVAAGHHGRIVSGLVVRDGGQLAPITVELAKVEPGEEPRMELMGIGAVLSARDDALLLGQVLKGGGAEEAGLAPGDAIVAIDGSTVVELGFERAIQSIRGPEGSTVRLLVRKGGQGDAVEVAVRRKRVRA